MPNPHLLDNHQDELAEELAKQEYVVHARLTVDGSLEKAVRDTEAARMKRAKWPHVNSGKPPRMSRGFAGIMNEEMGFARLD